MEQRYFKNAVSNVQTQAIGKYKQAASAVDGFVSASPWKAVGIAAAVGALIGFYAARR